MQKAEYEKRANECAQKEKEYTKQAAELDEKNKYMNRVLGDFQQIIDDNFDYYPKLAAIMADLETLYYERSARYLETKAHPAYVEAKNIRHLREDTKKILQEKKQVEYKLAYIQEVYPELKEIFDSAFNESTPPPLLKETVPSVTIDERKNTIDKYKSMLDSADHVIQMQDAEVKELRSENERIKDNLAYAQKKAAELTDLRKKYDESQCLIRYYGLDRLPEIWDKDFIEYNKLQDYLASMLTSRFYKAIDERFVISSHIYAQCKVRSFTDPKVYYDTSLIKCSCEDYNFTKLPCKHMLALALKVHAFDYQPNLLSDLLDEISRRLKIATEHEKEANKQIKKLSQSKKNNNRRKHHENH